MGSSPSSDDALKGSEDPRENSAFSADSAPTDPDLVAPSSEQPESGQGLAGDMILVDELEGLGESVLGLEVGRCFGNYRLERLVGKGSFAEVWLAVEERDHGFAKRVALKLMKAGAQATAGELEAMRAEARLCGMLHHPRLVDVYAAGDIDGVTYIAMEYVEGMTLHELHYQVRRAGLRFPLSVVLDIAIQLCEGLDYAHNAKNHEGDPLHLVHRDLKPGNIMVSRDGQVKIADFGLAKTTTSEQATKEGMLRGTPGFVAPEVWRGTRDFRPSVDLFALGAILFEIATGKPLFVGELHAVIFRVVSGDVEEDLQQLRLHRPVLGPVLKGLLERAPEKRMQQAWEALEPLKAIRRKEDAPGGLRLFLDFFLPDAEQSRRLQVLPSTEDQDWQAVLGSVSLLSESVLIPLVPEVSKVAPTRSMAVRAPVAKPSGKLEAGLKSSQRGATSDSRTSSRRRLWIGLGFLVFLFLASIGAPFIGDSSIKSRSTVDDDLGSSAENRGKRVTSESFVLGDEGGSVKPRVEPSSEPPPPAVKSRAAAVQKSKPPVKARAAAVQKSKPPVKTGTAAVQENKLPAEEVTVPAEELATEKPVVEVSGPAEGSALPSVAPINGKGCLVLKSIPGGLLVSLNGKDQGWSAGKRGREEEVDPGWYEVGMGANPGEIEASVKVRVRGGDRVEVRCLWGAKSSCKTTKLAGICGESS